MSAPRSGRTTLLRGLARAVDAAEGPELIVLLIDERPEEATAWREAVPEAEIATATADLAPAEQVRLAELALERARRRAESGADVVLIVDSLSRLAVASGKAAEVKRLFGSGRDLAEEGAGIADRGRDGGRGRGGRRDRGARGGDHGERADPARPRAGRRRRVSGARGRANAGSPTRRSFAGPRSWRRRGACARCSRDLGPVEAAGLIRERIESSRTNAELLAAALP